MAAEDRDDIHSLDQDFRSIHVEAQRPASLQLDKMFLRAGGWTASPSSQTVARAPSPPRRRHVYPLPRCLPGGQERSPLAELFTYSELVPHVLRWFERPSELAILARVSKDICGLARKMLYAHVWIRPWEEHCQEKASLVRLFDTLHRSPHLCQLIKSLDVRFFPLATKHTERYTLEEHVVSAFEKMANLQHLVWTRDKSLNPALMETVTRLPHLRTLEISGHSERYYDPANIGQMHSLEELRVMMPGPQFRDNLLGIIRQLGKRDRGGLKGLAIIARTSPLVDDELLKKSARHLRDLRSFTLWGCSRASKGGVFAVLEAATQLEELSIDALGHSGLLDLSRAPDLLDLRMLSLSFPPPHRTPLHPNLVTADLPTLPHLPNLTSLFLTLSSDRSFMPHDGISHLASQVDFGQLNRLSILNLFHDQAALDQILHLAPGLEELYISVNGRDVLQTPALRSTRLRILHVNAPERWGPTVDHLTDLAREIDQLEQIGSGNRVYEVHRRLEDNGSGGNTRVVELCRWTRVFTPGYFQIWRG